MQMSSYRKRKSKINSVGGKNTKPGSYTNEEDALIIKLYDQYMGETNKWKIIAVKLYRGHKSIRERYVNHLDPTIDRSDFTNEEKNEINNLQNNPEYFRKWAEIAKRISVNRKQGRRTELQVKNYWNSKDRTQKRKNKRSYERIHNIMNINHIVN
ncbi:hypothetical protein GLOIN_2v1884734 [Rhizophagus irregularis DAOM 181602=DAOM 197198]|uniref:Myb-like domain-containing protein n=2 Tax=Rhizophagus irregularis TaxID=588596 RepID=U9U6E2_RHIID|nr:hypothetical protein GLOIN_2v1884734 [Rhizophagus irregularis DAOM 181602=DAOM 197198]POG59832.1 hypothetical protein GLOIN_2v1884734 [Rhizophagus irregularis DAOM 181602=DAOM 197198]|eukprot:XP_025166698.1 hypothetical protein GLOIN_2v1884734 [Rhizophagus irregularis DAOM 181602=DAOM 197198]